MNLFGKRRLTAGRQFDQYVPHFGKRPVVIAEVTHAIGEEVSGSVCRVDEPVPKPVIVSLLSRRGSGHEYGSGPPVLFLLPMEMELFLPGLASFQVSHRVVYHAPPAL